jgi:hypothetical protein
MLLLAKVGSSFNVIILIRFSCGCVFEATYRAAMSNDTCWKLKQVRIVGYEK